MRFLDVLFTTASCVTTVQAFADTAEKHDESSQPLLSNPKYFKESLEAGPHYDVRYASSILDTEPRNSAVRVLIQTYFATMRDLGVETWLMHGSLMGWWWGKRTLPWDDDADLQMSEADMYFLASYFNMSTYFFRYEDIPRGRTFLLDINPYFKYRGLDDGLNYIDARWIDMDSGLFVDITAARYSLDPEEGEGMLYDKSGHRYRDTYLYPLLNTTFEGVPVKIPFRYKDMLQSEYSQNALKKLNFNSHHFDDEQMRWIPDES